jgi:hypothetical protein
MNEEKKSTRQISPENVLRGNSQTQVNFHQHKQTIGKRRKLKTFLLIFPQIHTEEKQQEKS